MPVPVALDTNALIYALEGQRYEDPAKQLLGRRVTEYLSQLAKVGTPVVLPTVVMSEFLVNYEPAQFDALVVEFQADYVVEDFGPRAAKLLAEFLRDKAAVKAARERAERTGDQIKLDALIAATALAAGATEIVTRDRDYETLTAGRLRMRRVDDLPLPQPTLVDDLPEAE